MSSLTLTTWTMPAAKLGAENPLPPLIPSRTPSAAIDSETGNAASYPDQGAENHILPYRAQNQYDRHRTSRNFKAAVLENDYLRATFLLELGGRLWSLFHKPSKRELLFVNPVFQPANLAVRDAWFCGGVEWNIGIIGHSPFTCSPLFAARAATDDGTPVLRLYEFERIRAVPFQIDFYLPEGSSFLMVRPSIFNTTGHATPMYWWSNVAVPEQADVRIIGPACQAYRHDYDHQLKLHEIPICDGVDLTYSTHRMNAADMYMCIPPGRRPWITALDKDGKGLVQTSTGRLLGRKAFNWGMGPGGRHWQQFLSQPGQAYIEIQAGLARTQAEYLLMERGAHWSWLEAYGLAEASPQAVHGPDWPAAQAAVETELERRLPASWMEAELKRSAAWAARSPIEVLHNASGWGALEQRRRAKAGETPLPESMPFPDDSIGPEQTAWAQLLEDSTFPLHGPTEPPGTYMVQSQWHAMLEEAARSRHNAHWLAWLHLGVMRFRAQDSAGARKAWEHSMSLEPSAWACRNLALLARLDGDLRRAAELLERAHRMLPSQLALAIECFQALGAAGKHRELVLLAGAAPDSVRVSGRVRLIAAKAALEIGDLQAVADFFQAAPDIANIREGELSLSELWFGWQEKRLAKETGLPIDDALRSRVRTELPPPDKFDFRMSIPLSK